MKIVDGSVYSKEELVEIINHILNAEYDFTKYHYMIDYQFKKTKSLLNQAEQLVKKMKSLPHTQQGLVDRMAISKKIDEIHKRVNRIEKSIVID
ncbi:hypothetical protein [Filifactor alocis]|uniref:hypothetical protein n=1 Tax=Filifactor alocis TaxID=143361 RepID=UPI003C6F82EC